MIYRMTVLPSPVISIVIPCYNEEAALPETMKVLTGILNSLKSIGEISENSYVLCVDDGSKDNTLDVIRKLNASDKNIRGIALAHNRGHQYALLAGLMTVKSDCDAAISIDADLQDDPDAIKEMISLFKDGAEIVYGVRESRQTDTWFKRVSARSFYSIQSAMGLETVYDHADYRLMSRRAIEILSEYRESNLFLRGVIPQIGLKTGIVKYDRHERVAGESKYPLKKMIAFSVDGITSFSAKPMRWVFFTGLLLLLLDVVIIIYVLGSYLNGNYVSGWSSLMISIWFLGSLILMAIGVVGEYVGKVFVEVKARPRFNIMEYIGL